MTDLNVPPETESASGDDRVLIGGRVQPAEAQLIDAARAVAGYRNRNDFVATVVMRETRAILKRQRAEDQRKAS